MTIKNVTQTQLNEIVNDIVSQKINIAAISLCAAVLIVVIIILIIMIYHCQRKSKAKYWQRKSKPKYLVVLMCELLKSG